MAPLTLQIRSENFVQPGIQTLVIDRKTTTITVASDDKQLTAAKATKDCTIFGVVGIMNVCGQNFLGII